MLFSVGLIFGRFFTAMISRANKSRRLFATLTGPRCLSSALRDFFGGWGDAFSTMAVYGVSRHWFRFLDPEEKEQPVLH